MAVQPGSRYEDAEHQFAGKHFYDSWGHPLLINEDSTLRVWNTSVDTLYMLTTLPLPPPPPAEYYAKESEHFPFLAFKFMQDSTRWWEIAEVNPGVWYPLDLEAGMYLRVPS
jgi:hypothetical protein